ncbi:GNAT family N-acetyltransferase [Diplocloster modestus]|uniref:GNAT family N-acetyltransferase n=1 Tax=Diplocloster modestus TaxID=2850322 RepID=A0ABS6K371_9FIRM|nr:GNAT family N-acetyltransferase [Diplocloster modestus]MBU9724947.1 GNAT family N-acetyltransferase [Diplocloster modestus]
MKIRLATVSDNQALLKIYAQYIDTPITFECVLPAASEFAVRIAGITRDYPYLVCEEGGKIIGYAYAHRQMEREAYQWNAELSVYIDSAYTSKGLGKKLYLILMEILRLQGIRTVYGGVTVPNVKSERLHLSLGFKPLGTYHHTGYKCGKWYDVTWFEKAIAPYSSNPEPIRPVHEMTEEKINDIIKLYM